MECQFQLFYMRRDGKIGRYLDGAFTAEDAMTRFAVLTEKYGPGRIILREREPIRYRPRGITPLETTMNEDGTFQILRGHRRIAASQSILNNFS